MPTVQRTFTVDSPLERVVTYLADFSHAETWDPGTKSCTRVDGDPLAVGARWHNVSEFRGKETELEYRLDVWEPEHLVFVGKNKTVTSTDDLRFRAVDVQRTEVIYVANFDFHGLAALAGPLLKPALEKVGDDTQRQMTKALANV